MNENEINAKKWIKENRGKFILWFDNNRNIEIKPEEIMKFEEFFILKPANFNEMKWVILDEDLLFAALEMIKIETNTNKVKILKGIVKNGKLSLARIDIEKW